MKLVSLLLSIAVHIVIVILFYVVIIYEHRTIKTSAKIYSVNLVAYQQHKNTTHVKKTFSVKAKKIKHKVKIKPKIKKKVSKTVIHKPKPKPKKYKNNIYKKRIEEKIRRMRDMEKKQKIEAAIKNMREKINKNSSEKLKKKELEELSIQYNSIIHQNWYMDTNLIKNQHLIAILDIRLDCKGNIINIGIVKHSGNGYFDRSTINAAEISDPLPKPPADLLNSGGYIKLIVKFDSKEKEKL